MKIFFSYSRLAIILALFFISCSKKRETVDNSTNPTNSTGLAGSWKWIRTDGGIGNNIHDTPASTGLNIELQLNNNNEYSILTNGIQTSQGTYALVLRDCIHDHTDKTVIDFSSNNDNDLMIESIEDNILTLSDENYDGTNSQYQRN